MYQFYAEKALIRYQNPPPWQLSQNSSVRVLQGFPKFKVLEHVKAKGWMGLIGWHLSEISIKWVCSYMRTRAKFKLELSWPERLEMKYPDERYWAAKWGWDEKYWVARPRIDLRSWSSYILSLPVALSLEPLFRVVNGIFAFQFCLIRESKKYIHLTARLTPAPLFKVSYLYF